MHLVYSSSSPAIHCCYRRANIQFLVVRAILREHNSLSKLIMKQLIVFQKYRNVAIAMSDRSEETKKKFTNSAKCQVTTSIQYKVPAILFVSSFTSVHQSEWFFLSTNASSIIFWNFWCASRKKITNFWASSSNDSLWIKANFLPRIFSYH